MQCYIVPYSSKPLDLSSSICMAIKHVMPMSDDHANEFDDLVTRVERLALS